MNDPHVVHTHRTLLAFPLFFKQYQAFPSPSAHFHSTRRGRTLICQGGTRGDLRQWSYTAGEVPPLPQHRGDFEDGGVGAASARPRSESAPPVGVVRKLTHQVMASGGEEGEGEMNALECCSRCGRFLVPLCLGFVCGQQASSERLSQCEAVLIFVCPPILAGR